MSEVRPAVRSPLSNSPICSRRRFSAVLALVATTALLFAGCGSDDGDESTSGDDASTTTETPAPSSTEDETTTSAEGSTETTASTPEDDSTTSVPTTTSEPTEGGLAPGDPCSLEDGDPDCIDPDGDGEGVYLEGGADCAATAPDISVCEDLDGDGVAGYPDEYEDLPQCSDEVPPPCNNEPGGHEE